MKLQWMIYSNKIKNHFALLSKNNKAFLLNNVKTQTIAYNGIRGFLYE